MTDPTFPNARPRRPMAAQLSVEQMNARLFVLLCLCATAGLTVLSLIAALRG